jgi:hypothetical protein
LDKLIIFKKPTEKRIPFVLMEAKEEKNSIRTMIKNSKITRMNLIFFPSRISLHPKAVKKEGDRLYVGNLLHQKGASGCISWPKMELIKSDIRLGRL